MDQAGQVYVTGSTNTPGSGVFTEFGTVGANAKTVTFDFVPEINAEWRVKAAYDSSPRVLSAPSNTSTLELHLNVPTNFQVSATGTSSGSDTVFDFSWSETSAVESGFAIFYRPTVPANGTFSVLKTVPTANTTSTSVTSSTLFMPGTSYDFQIMATYSDGVNSVVSDPSSTVAARAKDRITSRLYEPITLGQAFNLTLVTTSGVARTAFTASGLPPGLSFDGSTGVISGTPTQTGVFAVALSATFADGFVDTKTLSLRVARPSSAPTLPVVVSARTVGTDSPLTVPLVGGPAGTALFADPDAESAVRVTTSKGSFDIVLQNTLTPLTVANFMSYVNAGDYDGVAFHRAPSGFVVQGGAFKPSSATSAAFTEVSPRPSPLNEPGLSNLFGTVAMAKVGGNPNSATHDFFVNLGNNSANLDNQNGGFTVFGRVAGSGMDVVNTIANLPKGSYTIDIDSGGSTNPQGPYDDWPIDDGSAPSSMDNSKVVTMTSVAAVPVLSFAVTNNTDPGVVDASIVDNDLVLTGLVNGTSTVTVTATDLDGLTAQQTIVVTIVDSYPLPSITTQPAALTKIKGQDATFTVAATGSDLTYQWRKNGIGIPDATSSTLSLTNVQPTDVGDYSVLVSNNAGFRLSNAAHLSVQVPVTIVAQPISKTANYGSSVTFTVSASGDAPITYQWKKGDTIINSATGSSYTINNLQLTDAGTYSVVVTNPVNPPNNSVPSDSVELTVLRIDTDGDGLTDDAELALAHPTSVSNPDSDGDGFEDGLEVGAGSDPNLATSKPATTVFYAQKDGAQSLTTLPMGFLAGATVTDRLSSTDQSVAGFWLSKTELTNRQFASILQRAKKDGLISVNTESGRRVVRYPATAGEIVCYLATPAGGASDPPSCDVDLDGAGSSFTIPIAQQDFPACAVTWHGAYLCSLVLNAANGYAGKNLPATWSYDGVQEGFHIPNDIEWELAGRGISPTLPRPGLAYPTGASVSAALAWFNQTAPTAGPKKTKSYPASRLGVYDLAGNVEEWVVEGTDASSAYTRGGSYADPATKLLNTASESLARSTVSRQVGVRLALKAVSQPVIAPGGQPQHKFVRTGTAITLSVTASGPPPLSYQWYKNNVALVGKTASTLSIPSPVLADAGSYTVKVFSNGVNPTTSDAALVAIVEASSPPPLTTIAALKGTSFTVKAAGAAGQTFAYKWKNASGDIGLSPQFSDPTRPKLVLSSMLPSHSGVYTCEVTLGGPVTSLPLVTSQFQLLALQTPVLTNANFPANIVVSRSLSVPVLYDDTDPTKKPTSFLITGLPAGLTYNKLTGVISGKPTVLGLFTITITASNIYGTSDPLKLKIIVNGLDAFLPGNWVGLIDRNVSPTLNNDIGGRLDLSLLATGTYTAKVNFNGKLSTFTGAIDSVDTALSDPHPTLTAILPRAGSTSLKLSMKLNYDTLRLVDGKIEEVPAAGGAATATALITGWRAAWSSTIQATNYAGTMNVGFTPAAGDPQTSPQGAGYATLKVTTTGSTTLAGKLADGTAITGGAYLGPTGQVLHYQPLYSGTGTFLGLMNISSGLRVVSASTGAVTWLKKPAPTSRNYRNGFNIVLTPVGKIYTPPGTGVLVNGLTAAGGVGYPKNARLTFTSGGLALAAPLPPNSTSTSLVQHFIVATGNKVQMPTDALNNPRSVTVTVNATTGAISGTFTLSDVDATVTPNKLLARKVSWYGLIVPGSGAGGTSSGVGYFTLPKMPNAAPDAHTINTSDILSGSILFDGVPLPP